MTDSEPSEVSKSYYSRFVRQFFAGVKDKWWEGVIAVATIVVVLIFQVKLGQIVPGQEWPSLLVNITPSLLVLAIYVGYHLIRAPKILDVLREQEIADLEAVMKFLKEEVEPRLELVFKHESPYEDFTHYGLYGKYREYYRIVRVGVRNKSRGQTVYGVTVTLKDFIYAHRSFNGVPFRRKDNWAPPYAESFSLAPDQEEYVDIAMRQDAPKEPNRAEGLIFCHCRAPHIQDHFGYGPYYLTILVSASNAPPVTGRFRLFIEKGSGENPVHFVRLIPFDPSTDKEAQWLSGDQAVYGAAVETSSLPLQLQGSDKSVRHEPSIHPA